MKLGLDRPVVEQFGLWLWGLLHGDHRRVDLLQPAGDAPDCPAARAHGGADAVDPVRLGGARHSDRRRGGLEGAQAGRSGLVMGFAVLGFAVPGFVLAYVMIYFFAVQLAPAAGAGLSARSPAGCGRSRRA
jgi:peptide/nickel transport system permease protein